MTIAILHFSVILTLKDTRNDFGSNSVILTKPPNIILYIIAHITVKLGDSTINLRGFQSFFLEDDVKLRGCPLMQKSDSTALAGRKAVRVWNGQGVDREGSGNAILALTSVCCSQTGR